MMKMRDRKEIFLENIITQAIQNETVKYFSR